MTYIDINGIKRAFAEHLKKYCGYSEKEAENAVSDFPDPYENCYLAEEFLGDTEIDGIEYEKRASYTEFWRIGLRGAPMFKFYTYYCSDDITDHTVGDYLSAKKLFQVDEINDADFPND